MRRIPLAQLFQKSIAKDGGEVNYRGQVTFWQRQRRLDFPHRMRYDYHGRKIKNQIRFRLTKFITAKCP